MTGTGAPTTLAASSVARSHVRYLRRKLGKGLVILVGVERQKPDGVPDRDDLLCLRLEGADPVGGRSVRMLLGQVDATLAGGEVDLPAGLSLRVLPDDPGLPGLRAAWSPQPDDSVCQELGAMLARATGTPWRVVAASAVPLRYKPGSRCVIRYRLGRGDGGGVNGGQTTVYGKLFAGPEQAEAVDRVLGRLAAIWDARGPWQSCSPRSLGVVGAVGMNVTEDAAQGAAARSGHSVLRPSVISTPAGRIAGAHIPAAELRLVAGALARLHTGGLGIDGLPRRTGRDESERALQRGAALAGSAPALSSRAAAVSRHTSTALAELNGSDVRACHGGFKPSQLLFCADGHLAVVDWDGVCAADPALDVGYFAAYLRPASLWYERPGVRSWFTGAARCWRDTYRDEMTARGVSAGVAAEILRRAFVYEAALLLKIATRRVNRLNSPRPRELVATLAEAERCLAASEVRA